MSTRRVSSALLHTPIFVAGVGQLASQLAPVTKGGGKIRELTLEWADTTLNVTVNGVEVGVPHTNVQCVTFEANKSK